ncbi:MAG: hypothetical protein N4A57_17385 [Anaeromicrobium sp.]|jgi:hypothetical protein|uniref:hypothetical protein n=1 Tax=Anaeromicrobium sp. TaxID=1929132 RepID=UPI0025E52B8A|nr:hypothetical protein [Anaeromicrobium sp.]MCT4596023.1 hypothetical protein [Anaeromicrobium sp.]
MKNIVKIDSNNIYQSFVDNFGINKGVVEEYIYSNLRELLCVDSVKEINVQKFINYIISKSSDSIKSVEDVYIDKITISHLTTRKNKKELENNPIRNLFNVLTESTTLQKHFAKHNIIFKKYKGILRIYNDGILVDFSDYYNKSNGPTARMISRRFEGNSFYGPDKCVNGFLFNKELESNGNVRHIQYYPEILENIARVIKKNELINDWQYQNKTFKVTFWVDVNNLTFDNNKYLNYKRKVFLIYRYLLYFLIKDMYSNWDGHDNPIIRLKDGIDVSSKDIYLIEEIKERI